LAKVIVGKLAAVSKAKRTPVALKRVRDAAGKTTTIRTIKGDDEDAFDRGLRYVFKTNVARARRENKRMTGSADFVPGKR
jgi:hypothetical protein